MNDPLIAGFTLLTRPPKNRARPVLNEGGGSDPPPALNTQARLRAVSRRIAEADPSHQAEIIAALESALDGRAAIVHLSGDAAGPHLEVIEAALNSMVKVSRTLDRRRHEEAIAKLADVMVPDELGVARGVLAADNLALRDRFIATVPTLVGRDIGEKAGHSRSNPHATAARWKKGGDIFSVHHRGTEHFPAFQFRDDGRPRPIVRRLLAALPPHLSEWERAFWFVSTNGWLNDRAPADTLGDEAAVLSAASREAETVVG